MSQILIPNCRLGYPKLLKPESIMENGRPTGEPRFGVNLHLPNDPALLKQCQDAVIRAWQEKWPDQNARPPLMVDPNNPQSWFNKNHKTGMRSSGIRVPLVFGPAEWPDDPNVQDGVWVIICAAQQNSPPAVVDFRRQPIQNPNDVYPGAEAYAHVAFYGYQRSGSVGIGCGINGVMLTGRDVGRFDSKPTTDQMFGDVQLPPPAADQFGQQGYQPPSNDDNPW